MSLKNCFVGDESSFLFCFYKNDLIFGNICLKRSNSRIYLTKVYTTLRRPFPLKVRIK